MPSQVNEEMVLVARDCQSVLDICDKIADAGARLLESGRTRLLESPQLAPRLSARYRDSAAIAAARLGQAPVIARIVCKDESNRTRIFYVTPAAPPSGVARANLASIYSALGRLASAPLGSSLKTPKGENLVLIERTVMRPRDYQVARDVNDALFESLNREPLRVKSLRAFTEAYGERRRPAGGAEAGATLRPEALDVVVDPGETRPLKTLLSLEPPLIASAVQDDVARLPLAARLVIIGPPGSGKTTALLRRLDFLTSREALEDGEPGSNDRLDRLAGRPHATSWLLITPTPELLAYLKEAAEGLAIASLESNAAAWPEERASLAGYLGLLGSLTPVPDGEGGLSSAAVADTIGWHADFTAFHLDGFYRSLANRAAALAADRDSGIAELGADLAALLDKARGKPLPWFRESLEARREAIAELVEARSGALSRETREFFERLADSDESLVKGLITLESPGRPAADDRLRGAAYRLYRQAVSDQALALHRGRALPKGSRSAKVVAWLGEGRLPGPERLAALGADRAVTGALRRFKVDDPLFIDGYVDSLVPSYLRFKRRGRAWYDGAAAAPSRVEGLEIDLLLLAVLDPLWELARLEGQEPQVPASRAAARHRRLTRLRVLVDEASDLSPVQLRILSRLANPATGSVTLAADLALSATPYGLRSLEQLEWALPRHELVELSVNYRQSRRLAELADSLAGGSRARLSGSFHSDPGAPAPALVVNAGSRGAQARWLADRILEIRERSGRLPIIGVLAPEAATSPIYERLAKLLEPAGVPVSILGPDQPAARGVVVLTPAAARGLEFEGALLVDPPAESLYLAVTRAVSHLGLCLSGELPSALAGLRTVSVADWAQPEVPLETLDI